jgi:nucleoside-diphosphate-sugar epimerase
MSKGTILITGLNGFIGAVTAGAYLDAGWKVRGSVRKVSSAKAVQEALKSHADAGHLEIVEVPDITAPGAFDKAVQGVTAVAHLASPVSLYFTDPDPVIDAAVNGTKSILASIAKYGDADLKSLVVTGSVAAILNASLRQAPHTYTEEEWNEADADTVGKAKETGEQLPGMTIYRASKTLAERAVWDFVKEEKPKFAVTVINPTYVLFSGSEE